MFDFLDVTDTQTLLGLFVAITPFVIMWLRALNWHDVIKFAVVLIICAVEGLLMANAAGTLDRQASILQNVAVIYLLAQAVYKVAFQSLGLERVLYPNAALVNMGRTEVTNQLTEISAATAKDVVSTSTPSKLTISSSITPGNTNNQINLHVGVADEATKSNG